MWSRPQYTDLTYMRGTRPCRPMRIIIGFVIWSCYLSLNVKIGVNRTFHELKIPVYRFDLYERYRILWADEANFWYCYLNLVYKPKYHIWCKSDVPCVQEPSIPIGFIWVVPDPVNPFSILTSVWVIQAMCKFSSL